ncbi:Translation initiation factor [Rhodotorula toruloides ATCC 204091]|uniref:RNA helicase n=1 Tax=Rhodotorula toruloides TaxID=5286 RepID=A0A0K3CK05_RHOTO|nr:Translation initiation factor [Rhodotorula toruloides ATCC 204091]PRQ74504.1 translation initiation factor [Rhodotorula toruloides]
MASSPSYQRAAPPASRASPSPHSPFFAPPERSNSSASTFSFGQPSSESFNLSPDDHRFSPSLASSFGAVSSARPYPSLEQRSFRDSSLAGDVVVPRDERQNSLGASMRGGQAGAIGEGRKSSVGAIGDGRKTTPSSTPAVERREEELLLGLPSGIFDANGSLAAPGSSNGAASEQGQKSRPSSFILDVLPQTRERSGPPTPSLSLDSVSQPPPTAGVDFHTLPSPHSLAPSTYLNQTAASSTASLSLSSSGNNLFTNSSRTSSPGPLDNSGLSVESLATKVNTLEGTVSGLSNLIATEFRSLREEVGLLRSLVFQQQQNQPSSAAMGARGSVDRPGAESPVLTLRSPSPHPPPAFAQPIPLSRASFTGSNASLLAQPATSPGAISPRSAAGGFFGADLERQPSQSNETSTVADQLKDKQIKLLTAQVNSLSTTVSHLLANPGLAAAAASPSGHAPMRGMSLPLGSPALGLSGPATGLGIGGGNGPLAGSGRPAAMLRTASGSGLARTASMRSASASGPSGLPNGSMDANSVTSASAWDGGMSSPMIGSGPGGASPMLGSNPPGSLGSKWEVLGVGNDLFRAIAKYGLGPPTKIQGKAIPAVVRGQDVVAQAPAIQERIQCYVVPAIQLVYTHANLAAQLAAAEGTAPTSPGVQVVIVTATVDQAAQAQRLAVGLGSGLGIRTSLCVGSSHDIQSELQNLLKAPPHILVGTPQKLLDLFSLRTLPTASIRLLAIDETDQLIARNLSDHVINISRLLPATVTVPVSSGGGFPASSPVMSRTPLPGSNGGFDSPFSAPMSRFGSTGGPTSSQGGPPPTLSTVERQMAIFSCTVPQDVLNFATSMQLKEPVKVLVRRENAEGGGASPSMRSAKHFYMYLAVASNPAAQSKAPGAGRREASGSREWKLEALADFCEDSNFEHAVIFASSLESVEAVTYKLGSRAIDALALHSEMGPSARQQTIAKFRSLAPNRPGLSSKRVLVVYDALSKSLSDVGQVPLVINFDMPRAVEDYVHRIACASGHNKNSMVLNVVTPNEVELLRSIESFFRVTIRELPPNFASV